MLLLNILGVVLAGLLLLLALMLFGVARQLRRLRWKTSNYAQVPREAIPTEARALLDLAAADLQAMGYHYLCSMRSESPLVTAQPLPIYADLYRHSSGYCYASVTRSSTPSPRTPFAVRWMSFWEDGSQWITLNAELQQLPVRASHWQYFDDYLPDWKDAGLRHARRVAATGQAPCTAPEHALRKSRESHATFLDDLCQTGQLEHTAAGLQLPWRHALVQAWPLLRGNWRAGRLAAPATSNTGPAATGSTALAEIEIYRQQQQLKQANTATPWQRWRWTLLTALAFMGVGLFWGSWDFVLALLVVVAVHEGGHYLAMRLTGHRQLAIYFLPGLGGLATGEKADASPMEKLLVYLAGPMPGLLAAMAAYGLAQHHGTSLPGWAMTWVWLSLFINYLNLLPLTPLDGGRVLDIFLFARLPRARFGFALLCFAALLAAAIWLQDTVLQIVCVLIAIGLPTQWRTMQLSRALARPGNAALDQATALTQIFTALQAPRFHHWPFNQRAAAATALLPELQSRKAGLRQSALGLGIYLACLLAPLAVGLVLVPRHALQVASNIRQALPDDVVDAEPPRAKLTPPVDWQAQLARGAELTPQARLQTLLGAGQQALEEDNLQAAQERFQAAWALAQPLPARDLTRIAVLEGLADSSESERESADALQRIVQDLPHPQGMEIAYVARALEQLSYREAHPAGRVALLQRALELRAADRADSFAQEHLAYTRLVLAQALDQHQQPDAAQAQLQQRIDDAPTPAAHDKSRGALHQRLTRTQYQTDYAWYLLGHSRPREARALAHQALAPLPQPATVSWLYPEQQLREVMLWSALLAQDTDTLGDDWRRYQAAHANTAISRSLALEIDQALVAQALKDQALLAQARKGIEEQLAKGTVPASTRCQQFSLAQGRLWRAQQAQTRLRLLQSLGVCPPAS